MGSIRDDVHDSVNAVWRRPKVEEVTGIGRSTIYRGMADGTFPKSIKLGSRSVGWIRSEVLSWVDDRIKSSRPNNESTVGRQ